MKTTLVRNQKVLPPRDVWRSMPSTVKGGDSDDAKNPHAPRFSFDVVLLIAFF